MLLCRDLAHHTHMSSDPRGVCRMAIIFFSVKGKQSAGACRVNSQPRGGGELAGKCWSRVRKGLTGFQVHSTKGQV